MVIHLINYSAEYSGNFIPSLIKLSRTIYKYSEEKSILVFDLKAKTRQWMELLEEEESIIIEYIDKENSAIKNTKLIKDIINKYGLNKKLVLHSHFGFEWEMIMLKIRQKNIKGYWHIHSGLLKLNIRQKIKDTIKIKILANIFIDGIICVSEHIRQLCILRGYNENKCIVVHNGIDLLKHNLVYDKIKLRKKYNLPSDKMIGLAFGYDPIIKGVDILLNALKYQDDDFKLILIGRDELKSYIYNYEDYNDIKSKVILMKPMENIAELINCIDIFISSSRTEGFSYSIGEAMLHEKIVIVSNIEGTKHYLNSKGVLSYDYQNSLELNNIINRIKNMNKDNYKELAKSNKLYVTEKFSLDKWVKEIICVYSR